MAEEPKNPAARVRNQGGDWLRPIRAVSISFDVRKVALAAVGLLIVQAGWFSLDQMSPRPTAGSSVFANPPSLERGFAVGSPGLLLGAAAVRVAQPAFVLIASLWELDSAKADLGAAGRALLKVAMVVIVFGIVGGAIARGAVMETARGERLSLVESLRFTLKHVGALIAAPLFAMLAMLLCGLIAAAFGLLSLLPGRVGEVVGGVGFAVPMVMGLMMALLLFGLAASWPLMHAAVAAEGEDSIDALTRAFGIVNRRPVQFIALAALVWFVGSIGLVVVQLIAAASLHLAVWGASFTAPAMDGPPAFWTATVAFLVQSWVYAYFWSAAALVYLTLRRDIDGAPWSEIAPAAIAAAGGEREA